MSTSGASVTTEYYLTGDLKRQYGSRTYPVGYGYDYARRMKTMTNCSSFGTGGGARVTTWNYNWDAESFATASRLSPGTQSYQQMAVALGRRPGTEMRRAGDKAASIQPEASHSKL